jgi:hypothetical protein
MTDLLIAGFWFDGGVLFTPPVFAVGTKVVGFFENAADMNRPGRTACRTRKNWLMPLRVPRLDVFRLATARGRLAPINFLWGLLRERASPTSHAWRDGSISRKRPERFAGATKEVVFLVACTEEHHTDRLTLGTVHGGIDRPVVRRAERIGHAERTIPPVSINTQ